MSRALLIAALVQVCCILWVRDAAAQDSHSYGARGRTILQAGLQLHGSNLEGFSDPFHDNEWVAGMGLTLLHFVRDNIAVGGTLGGGAAQRTGPYDSPSTVWTGADVDVAFHLPMSRRLSMRFWVWSGIRQAWYTFETDVDTPVPVRRSRYGQTSFVIGLHPDLLIHLSPSIAIYLGPSVSLHVSREDGPDVGIALQHGLTYSFGPSAEQPSSRLDEAARFSSRGRNIVGGGLSVNNYFTVYLGYARFVRDRLAVGGYLSGGDQERRLGFETFWAGGGGLLLVDLPVARSVSVLSPLRLGYAWRGSSPVLGVIAAHELVADLAVFVALHLNERLAIGVGPSASVNLRVAQSSNAPAGQQLERLYVEGGLSSTLVASF